jgi:hypothetical protein
MENHSKFQIKNWSITQLPATVCCGMQNKCKNAAVGDGVVLCDMLSVVVLVELQLQLLGSAR